MNVARVAPVAVSLVVLGVAGAAFAYAEETPTEVAGPVPRSPRPAVTPCAPADLARSAWTGVRSPQDPPNAVVVLLSNNHPGRCTLAGSARIRGTDRAGHRVTLVSRPASRPAGGPAQYPATIDPGEPGRLVFTPVRGCRADVLIERVAVEVGGVEFPMAGTERVPECVIEIGEWHVIPPALHS